MVSSPQENDIEEEESLDSEISRVRYLDHLLLNDVKAIRVKHRLLYILMIIFAVMIVLAILTNQVDPENSELLMISLLFILVVIVIPAKFKLYKNLKQFNESKNKLERAGLYLWRRKERDPSNPEKNLIEVASVTLASNDKFIQLPLQKIDLNNYKKHL